MLAGTNVASAPIAVFQIDVDKNGWIHGSRHFRGPAVGPVVVVFFCVGPVVGPVVFFWIKVGLCVFKNVGHVVKEVGV